jgi:flap endonuclease-1
MGVKNFIKIIKKYSAQSIQLKNISDYRDKILGIDAHLLIYKMINAIRKNGYDIKNGDIIITHIHTLLLKIMGFIKYNITPVFVFDGLAPQIKEETLYKRRIMHETTQKKYDEAKTEEEKKKYYMRYHITDEEIDDCKKLISIFGYTIIDSIEEADSQLVELLNSNKIDYIVTDDMDILVFGGKNILKNFSVSSNKKIQEISLVKFKEDTNFTQQMIIDMSILIGCDYCMSAYGIGPIKAYKLILEHKNIENIIKHVHIDLNVNYKKARQYFLKPNVIDSKEIAINIFNGCDKIQLKKFLKELEFRDEYFDKICKVCCI